MAADWAIEAPARNRAAPAERSPKGDSVSESVNLSGDFRLRSQSLSNAITPITVTVTVIVIGVSIV